MPFPKKLLSRCLNAQLWALGRDIHHQSGNLLIEYGLQKHECPAEAKGSHRYAANQDNICIHVWAFGIFVHESNQPGIVVKRFTGTPRVTYDPNKTLDFWTADSMVENTKPLSRAKISEAYPSLCHLAKFFIHYEKWIASKLGETYRKEVLKQNKKLKLKAGITQSWRSFKDRINPDLNVTPLNYQQW